LVEGCVNRGTIDILTALQGAPGRRNTAPRRDSGLQKAVANKVMVGNATSLEALHGTNSDGSHTKVQPSPRYRASSVHSVPKIGIKTVPSPSGSKLLNRALRVLVEVAQDHKVAGKAMQALQDASKQI
jgi:hypothetical protein